MFAPNGREVALCGARETAAPAAGAGIGAVGVSVLELGTGLACRRLLHVEVWDYSQEWGNLAGLVCPKYTALWFLLCLWVLGMMRFLRGFAAYVARTKA